MDYTQDITLDLNTNTSYYVVGAKQGDANSRIIRVFITENGNKYVIPPNSTAYFRLRKPDSKVILNEATIDYTTNSVNILLTGQALAASGRGYADITLYGSKQEVLSTVAFILLIMAAPNVVGEATSSNEFGYLQTVVDNANATIHESEAWAIGTRAGLPVTSDNFQYQIQGSNFTCEIDEKTFKEKVGVYPGATNKYKFTYNGLGWIYTDPTGTETTEPVNLNDFGISVSGLYYATNSITVTVTDADLQYNNNAKYWAEATINAKDSVDNLDISATMLPPEYEPTVDKSTMDDVDVTYSSTALGTVTVNKTTFLSQFSEIGSYTFSYTGSVWQYDNQNINLATYGISYTGTPVSGNYITITYNQHKHFNFNIPRGLTGDVYFMTFEIDPQTGLLYMYRPPEPHDVSEVEFEIISTGANRGCLGVRIQTGGNG